MKLRILHVMTSVNASFGGPVEGVRQLAAQNRLLGHTVEVASLDDPGDPSVHQMGVTVHPLGSRFSRLHKYRYSPRFVPWLRINARNFDCVVINGIWSYNCFGAWRALRKTGIPFFVFPHGMLDPWSKYTFPLKHAKKWTYWPWAVYPVLRDADGVFFTCEEERRLARDTFWLYDCVELVVRYGVAGCPAKFGQAKADFLARFADLRGKRLVLFLSRIHPKKGLELVLSAVHQLRAEGKWDETMRLVVAGPCDDSKYLAGLHRLAEELDLVNTICWTGMLTGALKWGALQAADIFVLASHQENFGIAVVEALSVGTPVLVSRAVNIWSEIVHCGAGIDCAPTERSCTEGLRRWLELPEAAGNRMRHAAQKCWLECFDVARSADTFLSSVYLMLSNSRLAAHPELL